jgi:Holliday junction resolvase
MNYLTIKKARTTLELAVLTDEVEISIETGRSTETMYLNAEQVKQVLEFLTNAIELMNS